MTVTTKIELIHSDLFVFFQTDVVLQDAAVHASVCCVNQSMLLMHDVVI